MYLERPGEKESMEAQGMLSRLERLWKICVRWKSESTLGGGGLLVGSWHPDSIPLLF